MIIKYFGHSCFKIETKPFFKNLANKLDVFFDPFDEAIGLKPPKENANLVMISHNHSNHSNKKTLKGDFFTIDNPGEYTYHGISINGILSYHDDEKGEKRGLNTIFTAESEKVKYCHLGDIGHILSKIQVEKIGEVDVLFVPVGGKFTTDAKQAKENINQIEPKIVIPMHYAEENKNIEELQNKEEFYKTMGSEPAEVTNKLNLTANSLPETMQIIEMKIS